MSKKRASTVHQYEPLQVPSGWKDEEARLVRRLTEIFDDIYRRYGRLGVEDISTAFADALDLIRQNVDKAEKDAEEAMAKATDAQDNAMSAAAMAQKILPVGTLLTTYASGNPKTYGTWALVDTQTIGSDTVYRWRRTR